MKKFDYEAKLWGVKNVSLSPFELNSLKLKYTLEDFKGLRGKVLDIGCGGGGVAKGLKKARPDLDVVGMDISKKAIAVAKKNPEGVEFVVGDIARPPKSYLNRFDGVTMFDVLEHLEKPEKILSNVNRVLKKNGVLSLFVPLDGSMATIHGWVRRFGFIPKLKYAGHIQQFSGEDVLEMLTKTDFKIGKVRNSQYLFSQIVDFLYFIFISIRGKNFSCSVETYIEQERGVKGRLVGIIKSLISLISYLESSLFIALPGLGLQVKAVKAPGKK